MVFYQRITRCAVLAGIVAGFTSSTTAATRDEVARLDAAYPPGSVVVCGTDLPGKGQQHSPTIMEMRGTVMAHQDERTDYKVSTTFTPQGHSAPGLTVSFRMSQRSGDTGQYSHIDPDSIAVSIPMAGPAGEKTVLQGFRNRLPPSGESFTPYSQTEITQFPAYITRTPGEAPAYCHKENGND